MLYIARFVYAHRNDVSKALKNICLVEDENSFLVRRLYPAYIPIQELISVIVRSHNIKSFAGGFDNHHEHGATKTLNSLHNRFLVLVMI